MLSDGWKVHDEQASVAQLVEQWTENPCVAGSIPAWGIWAVEESAAFLAHKRNRKGEDEQVYLFILIFLIA